MHTYEIYSKEERKEIYREFVTTTPFWQMEGRDTFYYVSHEYNVSLDIDPHLPLRCKERYVSTDAFFLATETFFGSSGIDENGDELPSIADVAPDTSIVLCSEEMKVGFVFNYSGFNEATGMDEVLAKTVVPLKTIKDRIFIEGNIVFELKTNDFGEHSVHYVDHSSLKFKAKPTN